MDGEDREAAGGQRIHGEPGGAQRDGAGINETIGALKGLGFDEEAEVGRGFSGLSLSGLQVGDAGLQSAFARFCDRWSWGVRSLVQDGNQIAMRLGLTAGMYSDAEQATVGTVKDLANAAVGDPHMSDAQAAGGSWSQAEGGSAEAGSAGGGSAEGR